jgi:hypothetical protein
MRAWCLLACLWTLPAWATDFDPVDTGWTGLSKLVDLAGVVSLEIDLRDRLDWAKLTEADVLVLVAPEAPPSATTLDHVRRFLAAGGHLVVVDDYGQGNSWLAPFGLRLTRDGGTGASAYEEVSALPLVHIDPEPDDEALARRWQSPGATTTRGQFLRHGLAGPIVLNHPGALEVSPAAAADTVVWGHFREPGRAWLVERKVGDGRILALSDPSALINDVLGKMPSNRQFAANFMRFYCFVGRPCRAVVVPRLWQVAGQFQPRKSQPERATWRASLDQLAAGLRAVATAFEAPQARWLWAMIVLVALAWPILRLSRHPAPVLPPSWPEVQQDAVLRASLRAWLASTEVDFRRPTKLLVAHLERQMALRVPAIAEAGLTPTVLDRLTVAAPPQAAARLREVFRNLHEVAQDASRPVSRAEFAQLAADAAWAEELMQHAGPHAHRPQRSPHG